MIAQPVDGAGGATRRPDPGPERRMPTGLTETQQNDWIDDLMWTEEQERRRTCTCPGGWVQHDDEEECPCSPPCTCGPVYFNVYCPRHGDPGANLP